MKSKASFDSDLITIILLVHVFIFTSTAIANFQALPGIGWEAIFADGTTVVGGNYRWTSSTGSQSLGALPGALSSSAHGVSSDGSIVVGNSGGKPFIWTEAGGIQEINIGTGYAGGSANAISSDGSTVVGYSKTSSGNEAFYWTRSTGAQGLGYLPGTNYSSSATGVSAGGTVVVGASKSELSGPYNYEAFRWTSTDGMIGIGEPPTWYFSAALEVSDDGSVAVGYCNYAGGKEAFSWSENNIQLLGDLDGGRRESIAYDVSADAKIIIGSSVTSGWTDDIVHEAFIWDETHGMRNLKEVLQNDYGFDLNSWTLSEARAISANGLTIMGNGYNPDGLAQGWIVTTPEPATLFLLSLGGLVLKRKKLKSG